MQIEDCSDRPLDTRRRGAWAKTGEEHKKKGSAIAHLVARPDPLGEVGGLVVGDCGLLGLSEPSTLELSEMDRRLRKCCRFSLRG